MLQRFTKPAVFLVCLFPAIALTAGIFIGNLGPNPVETLTHETGQWGLRFLLLTLAVTPLRSLLRWHWLFGYRRMLGLFSFFYICLHLLVFLVFDHSLNPASIVDDIIERPYITVGFAAFVLMVPLAVTSFKALQRKMGRRWTRLHQLVYPVAILGVVHFWWLVKADLTEPLIYAVVLAALLGARVIKKLRRRSRPRPATAARGTAGRTFP